MKKITYILMAFILIFTLSACTQTEVTCGVGTVIQDGKCVAPDKEIIEDDDVLTCSEGFSLNEAKDDCVLTITDLVDLDCSIFTGTVFYEVDFTALAGNLVDNEAGNLHTADNFVIWGKTGNVSLLNNTSVVDGELIIEGLDGDQLDQYYNTGLGYQFFNFENDKTYTVCAVVKGPSGQKMTSEIGIYYGHGTKDDFDLTGDEQLIIQDFKPTLSTNNDYGQYVLFTGKITGDIMIKYIKIIEN